MVFYRVNFLENFVIFQNNIYTTKSKTTLINGLIVQIYESFSFCNVVCLLVCLGLFVTLEKGITGEGRQILTYTQHSWPHLL